MAPTPTTHFEAWGQALYFLPTVKGKHYGAGASDYKLLFAVADANHEWLAWYSFGTSFADDKVLMSEPHKVVAERSERRSYVVTQTPMTAEELCGPIMVSRGRAPGSFVYRPAFLEWRKHMFGPDEIDVSLFIAGLYRDTHILTRINLYLKRTGKMPPHDNTARGWATLELAEPFNYPVPHLNVAGRLRYFRHKLLDASG